MNGTPNAVVYLRVSTTKQEAEGVSLDAQRAKAEAWALANDYRVVGVHQDALSGKRSENRPGFQAALAQACEVHGALVVYSLSRFARSTRETIELSERLGRSGADLVSLSEHIDTTTAAGKMVFRMLAVLSEFERDQIAERTSMALQHLKAQGRHTGGQAPYGKTVDEDGNLVDDPYEQGVIREARRLYRPGAVGLKRVARHLNEQGYTSRGRRPFQATQVRGMVAA